MVTATNVVAQARRAARKNEVWSLLFQLGIVAGPISPQAARDRVGSRSWFDRQIDLSGM